MTTWLAEDMMKADVLTVNANMRVRDLAGFLSEHGISGAPVTDDAGRPVGVVSIMDIVSVDVAGSAIPPGNRLLRTGVRASLRRRRRRGRAPELENLDVEDIMTPVVVSVGRDAPGFADRRG